MPIILEGENPFAMMVDLQKQYNWVLNTASYDSEETLMKAFKPLIIDPAMKKRQELRLIKAQEPEVISAKDDLNKEKRMNAKVDHLDGLHVEVNALPAPALSGRELRSPSLHFGDGSQSAGGEEF